MLRQFRRAFELPRGHPSPPGQLLILTRRSIVLAVLVIVTLAAAAPALADYLGPDRVTTEFVEVRDPDNDVWTLTHVDPNDGFLDVCLIIHTCDEHPSVERQLALCGWVADNSGCTMAFKTEEQTVVLPEATISGDLQDCGLQDGWCTEPAVLHLEGSEPLAGETIDLIEGTRNGALFACGGTECDIPLLQGENDFTFWAHSSYGDTSQMGSLSAQVDSLGPSVGIPDSWYIWEPLAIQVSDSGVGVGQVRLTIDGGQYGQRKYSWGNLSVVPGDFVWDRHFGEIIAPIGEYPVTVTATDAQGNSTAAFGELVIPDPGVTGMRPVIAESADDSLPPSPSEGPSPGPAASLEGFLRRLPESDLATVSGDASQPDSARDATSPSPSPVGPEREAPALATGETVSADASPSSVSSTVTTVGTAGRVLWGEAALGLAGVAAGYGTIRRSARRMARVMPGPSPAELADSPPLGDISVETDVGAVQEFLDWLKVRASGASGLVGTVIALTRDRANSPAALTALWRLLRPELSPNPTETEMLIEQLTRQFRRGNFIDNFPEFERQLIEMSPENRPPRFINYTDLKQFLDGLKRGEALAGYNDLLAFGLMLAGEQAMRRDPAFGTLARRLGGSMSAAGDLWLGGRLLANKAALAEYAQAIRTPLGMVGSTVGGFAGAITLGANVVKLLFDPTIRDIGSNERWGVALQALGGGLIMVGSAAALLVAATAGTAAIAAGLTILAPVGLVLGVAGFVVENWDWISDGVGAYFGARENARVIRDALPGYINDTVLRPAAEAVRERVIAPVSERLRAWEGVAENASRIAQALPEYVETTVLRPAGQFIDQRVIEPVRNGLQAWPGVLENGRTILRELREYVEDTILRPAVRTVEENVLRPVARAIEDRVIDPVTRAVDRYVVRPSETFRRQIAEPVVRAVDERVVQPVSRAIDNLTNTFDRLFRRGP